MGTCRTVYTVQVERFVEVYCSIAQAGREIEVTGVKMWLVKPQNV
jgi:hypothetical protein